MVDYINNKQIGFGEPPYTLARLVYPELVVGYGGGRDALRFLVRSGGVYSIGDSFIILF